MKTDSLAPQQQRSRETLARLLAAALETLEEHGLDGTTIPRVASTAGMAAANVYRRFRDKHALFRAAFLKVLELSAEANQGSRPPTARKRTLEGVVGEVVGAISEQYRRHPGLLRALVRFVETDRDPRFRKEAVRHVASNLAKVSEVILAFRTEIAHADPERAVLFGLLTVGTVLEARALEEVSMWRELLPIPDREMQVELTRTVVAYLRSG
jgi:AcrR family transcriptional regulator